MERLTKRIDRSVYYTKGKYEETLPSECEIRDVRNILYRLAAYEDTGLEPETVSKIRDVVLDVSGDIDRLRELAQADKEGRCVVLPCKVGDKVWTNFSMSGWYFCEKDRPYNAKVVFVGLNGAEEMGGGLFNVVYDKHDHMMQFQFSDIGKTIFLTREEAEVALRREQE